MTTDNQHYGPTQAQLDARDAMEEASVFQLGRAIGYGRLMQLTQQCWVADEKAQNSPLAGGGAFAYGPCLAMVEPCGCAGGSICDWCCGSGWLTKKVKLIKNAMK